MSDKSKKIQKKENLQAVIKVYKDGKEIGIKFNGKVEMSRFDLFCIKDAIEHSIEEQFRNWSKK